MKSKRFLVSLVQILDKKLVWFGKDSIWNLLCSNIYPDRAIHLNEIIQELQTLTESTIIWFDQNHMIVNPSKFHAIIIRKDRKDTEGIGKW